MELKMRIVRAFAGVAGVLIAGAFMGAGSNAAAAGEELPGADQQVTTVRSTDGGLSVADVGRLVATTGAPVSEARAAFEIDGQTITVGIAGTDRGTLPDDVAATISEMVGLYGGISHGEEAKVVKTTVIAASDARAAMKNIRANGAVFTEVDLRGEVSSTRLPNGTTTTTSAAQRATGETPQSEVQLLACGRWYPSLSYTAASSDSSLRYNGTAFSFTSAQLAAFSCTGSGTFEPDYVTYNYDGLHYFGDDITTWSSNMPDAYKDTNAFDNPDERVYTIGSATAASFSASTTYVKYFRTAHGNASSDTAKMVWQRGTYTWGCPLGPAWCIYADESQIQYAWNITVPGTWTP